MVNTEILSVAADALRYFTIAHGAIFVVLIGSIVLKYIHDLKGGYKSPAYILHEITLLVSYCLAMLYMIFAVGKQLHHDFSWAVTPVVVACLLLGDVSVYYLFKHKSENKE